MLLLICDGTYSKIFVEYARFIFIFFNQAGVYDTKELFISTPFRKNKHCFSEV